MPHSPPWPCETGAMSDPRVVDVHVHLFERPDDPLRDGYDIWEYGAHDGVAFGTRRGTLDDLEAALGPAPIAHCVVLGLFEPRSGEPGEADRLRAYNDWLQTSTASSPELTPFVAADPTALGGKAGADHLRDCAARGAKGIKIHPIL